MAAADHEEECLSRSRREWLNCTRIASSPDSTLRFPLQAIPGFGWRAWESKQCSRPPLHAPLTSQVGEGNCHPQNMRCGQQRGSILPVSTQAAKQKHIPAHAPHHRTACSDSRLTCTRVCARVQVDQLPYTRAKSIDLHAGTNTSTHTPMQPPWRRHQPRRRHRLFSLDNIHRCLLTNAHDVLTVPPQRQCAGVWQAAGAVCSATQAVQPCRGHAHGIREGD